MPGRCGKKNGPSWRTWSYMARDVAREVHSALKQAMKNADNGKRPFSVGNLQDLGVLKEINSRTEGEALEVIRGNVREPGLEQWRR